jgi:hypothetical protein
MRAADGGSLLVGLEVSVPDALAVVGAGADGVDRMTTPGMGH